MTERNAWDLTGLVVLLPWGAGHGSEIKSGIRCDIERMGGNIAYRDPPKKPYGPYGRPTDEATHEFVPEGATGQTSLPKMTAADLKDRVEAGYGRISDWLDPLRRKAYVPVIGPASGSERASRYFGAPWMPDDMEWPKDTAGAPMNFVLQIDVAALPGDQAAKFGGNGLLLFFHGEAYPSGDDNRAMSHVTVADTTKAGAVRAAPEGVSRSSRPLDIVDWREVPDDPDYWSAIFMDGFDEKLDGLLHGYMSDTIGHFRTPEGREISERTAVEQGIVCRHQTWQCDKVGGWPSWEQGEATPKDAEGEPMEYLLQVGHEGIVLADDLGDIDWPTWGRGHVFVSRKTGEFAYVWACD